MLQITVQMAITRTPLHLLVPWPSSPYLEGLETGAPSPPTYSGTESKAGLRAPTAGRLALHPCQGDAFNKVALCQEEYDQDRQDGYTGACKLRSV